MNNDDKKFKAAAEEIAKSLADLATATSNAADATSAFWASWNKVRAIATAR